MPGRADPGLRESAARSRMTPGRALRDLKRTGEQAGRG
jgi:hypothetical protein